MKPKNAVMLLLTSLIWGTAFVAQSVGMDFLEPFTFNGVRSFIGGVTLLPCIWLLEKMNGKPEVDGTRKDLIQGGIACGLLLFAASSLQQMGIQYTTAGKAGFITAFYIVFVPVLGIFLKKAAGWKVWMSVFLALIGLYFLCIKEGFSIGKGDIMIFACALVFAVHILVIGHSCKMASYQCSTYYCRSRADKLSCRSQSGNALFSEPDFFRCRLFHNQRVYE